MTSSAATPEPSAGAIDASSGGTAKSPSASRRNDDGAATRTNDDADGVGTVCSPSKRPRISPTNAVDTISLATPAPASMEVIDISSADPPSRSRRGSGNNGNNGNHAFQTEKDPGVASPRKRTADDSDVEILSPSRYVRPGSGGPTNVDAGINDMHADEVEVTASTTTNANIEYPHMRHQCGVHPFSLITTAVSSGDANGTFCAKCYCFVCDVPAGECPSWKGRGDAAAHCHAHDRDEKWVQLREAALKMRRPGSPAKPPAAPPRNLYRNNQSQRRGRQDQGLHQEVTSLIHNEFLSRLATDVDAVQKLASEEQRRQRTRERKDMRVPEVLAENFQRVVSLREAAADGTAEDPGGGAAAAKENMPPNAVQKVEGDVPTLRLHDGFWVQGVHIGWPFPEIMKPQRQMAIHLIKALRARRHVVLESPTGTGKSAAILCAALGWQRWHRREEGRKRGEGLSEDLRMEEGEEGVKTAKVKIIYCSRTHSQVAQMVASLKSTPYRPRMAILGSRERLCIHRSIKPRGQNAEPVVGVNVNNECRLRVRNTEKLRKQRLSNPGYRDPYNDDDPPEAMPGDGDGREGVDDDDGDEGGDSENSYIGRSRTCPHYRQLTTSRVANLAHSTFVPNKQVDCCSAGGKKSKYGVHDIEDLVQFGVDPYLQKDVALYRRDAKESFGLSLKGGAGRGGGCGCFVREVKRNSPAEINGSIGAGDKILRVNGSDVSRSNPGAVVGRIKRAASDPLMLDVSRGGSGSLSSDGGYSSRAACPYYISQILSKDADIIFAPYNYVLDPGIRDALGIELDNSVVILDEAHNVESTLREAGSGKFGEFELCELVVMLTTFAMTERSTSNMMDVGGDESSEYLCDVAHTLLLFVEKVITKLRTARKCFQNNPGKKGAAMALREWERFHTPDDKEFEVNFDGPTGKGHLGKCVGCMPFFEKLGVTKSDLDGLITYVDSFQNFFRGRGDSSDESTEKDRISNLVDRLIDLVHKLNAAIQAPEHYYTAVVATANGSLEFASGGEAEAEKGGRRSWRKRPRALPLISPKTPANPDRPANPCVNPFCRAQCTEAFNPIRHGNYCDGSTPRWECHLHLCLLTPGPLMQELSNNCRTVVLASGSLSPIPSLCAELNLFSDSSPPSVRPSEPDSSDSMPTIQKRLQNQPRPLEADHVVSLEKQLFACSIGHFPDGSELKVSQKNYSQQDFLPKLGDALVRIVEGISTGGVLVFLPSYALLRKCERVWNPNNFRQNRRGWWSEQEKPNDGESVWDRLEAIKHRVVVEPSGGQDEFEEKRAEYMESVRMNGGCVLLAVYRGKMSEGISFNDNNARGVVCVGLPLPSAFALDIKVKMDYNDEQRRMRQRTDLLPGREWYNQQAYRAIAQALGRCIRHAADYGAIFLLDVRHCDDGSPHDGIPKAHQNLPKWMRRSVKNLSRHSTGRYQERSFMYNYVSPSSDVRGGWPGLKTELKRFFRDAKPYADGVLKKHKEKISVATKSTAVQNQGSEKSTSSPTLQSQTSLYISAERKTSSSGKNTLYFVDRQPSKSSQGSVKKKGSIQEMFKKQEEAKAKGTPKHVASRSSKARKKPTIKNMFDKQRTAASTSPSPPTTQEMIDVDREKISDSSDPDPLSTLKCHDGPVAQNNSPSTNAFTFKRSPFANHMLTPTTEVAASTSQLVLSQSHNVVSASQPTVGPSQALSSTEDEERLCVICEDGKKEVLLLPCKHMCLCKNCADKCLHDTIKECPMCRAPVKDSMEVFW